MRPHSSRQRYAQFVEAFRERRLDTEGQAEYGADRPQDAKPAGSLVSASRRAYLREYLRWLRPHRRAAIAVFALALVAAGLQMVEPLFLRYIVDHVLMNTALDGGARLLQLNLAGATFLVVIIVSNLLGAVKDYRQRMLNTRVMLSLRRALFRRFLHLPLPRLWDMKTGGILSRLTGDVDTTTGLLQMAVMSPSLSVIRLLAPSGCCCRSTGGWR